MAMGEDRAKAERTGEMRAPEEEAVDALRVILRRTVERHDAEAILLSGGLDTSTLALLAHERGSAQKAVTVVLDGAHAPDLTYARKVAQRFQLEHHVIRLTEAEALGTLPEVIAVLRSFDPALPNDLVIYTALNEAKKLGITSVMTGDGADELFAGYAYLQTLAPEELAAYIRTIASTMQFSSNKLGAALGLEIQQPYCDSALVDFALAISPELKVRERAGMVYGKWLLRRAFEAELGEIAWRAKDPIEVGSGTAQLRTVIRSRISDAAFEAKKRAYKLAFMNKEHLYFYELYRAVVGELPEPGRDAASVCPLCKVALPAAKLHCDICGFSQPIERYLGKEACT
jgi:asparagine synthase (glutamine-hydrolysing)